MNTFQAIILAIIEGITEFLPVSSTGHMVIASAFFNIGDDSFTKLYEVVIQFGAILSVVVLYWKKFLDFKRVSFYFKLFVAILPALAFGALFKKHIEAVLEKPLFISIVLFAGGVILLFVDKWFKHGTIEKEEEITYKKAFFHWHVPGTRCPLSWIEPQCRNHHWRHATKAYPFIGCGLLFLSCRTHHGSSHFEKSL